MSGDGIGPCDPRLPDARVGPSNLVWFPSINSERFVTCAARYPMDEAVVRALGERRVRESATGSRPIGPQAALAFTRRLQWRVRTPSVGATNRSSEGKGTDGGRRWGRRLRPRGRPREVPGRAGQAARPGPRRHPGPDPRRALRPVPGGPVHARSLERDPVVDEVDVVIVGGGIAGVLAGAQLRMAGVERIRIVDKAGRHRRHLVLEPLPGRDVRRRVLHLHADARGARVRARRAGTRSATRSAGTSRPSPTSSTSSRDALFHTGVTRAEWDDDGRPLAGAHRPRRRDPLPLVRAGGRDPQPAEAAGHPRHGGLRGPSFHTARWDYGYTGGGPGEPLTKLGDKVVGLDRHRRHGHPVPAAAGRGERKHVYVFQRTPSAIGVRGNRPTDPAFAERPGARLAAGADGQLPGDHARASRSRRTSSTTAGRTTTARSSTRPGGRA